jgi:hypothetical protein
MARRFAWLLLAALLLLIFHRVLFGEVLFWGLPAQQFVPWRDYAIELLRGGNLPLWHPFNGGGAPLLANYQSALLYPPTWLTYVLPIAPTFTVLALLHLWWGGVGMGAFAARLGVPPLGQAVTMLAFGLGGALVARAHTYPMIFAAAWLPWLLWAAANLLQRGKVRGMAWLALFTALILLCGHAQWAWYSLLLTGVFTLWYGLRYRTTLGATANESLRITWGRLAARWGMALGAVLLGALIAALQLAATAELLASSPRADGGQYGFIVNLSYGLPRTLNMLMPNFYGTAADGSYFTDGVFFEDVVYVGLIPLVAAFAALFTWIAALRKPERPAYLASVPLWAACAAAALWIAYGQSTPLFRFLYDTVPTFDLFQAPTRWHLWTTAALALLAGIGVEAAWANGRWQGRIARLALGHVVMALIVLVVVREVLDIGQLGTVQAMIRAYVELSILAGVAGALHLARPLRAEAPRRWLWATAVAVVVALDLGYFAYGLNPTTPAAFFDRQPSAGRDLRAYWFDPLIPADGDDPALNDVLNTVMYERYVDVTDYSQASALAADYRASTLPNMNILDRVPLFNNFDPLRVGYHAQYVGLIDSTTAAQQQALLLGAGVGQVYTKDEARVTVGGGQTAWLVSEVCWHADDAAVTAALLNDWQPYAQAHLANEREEEVIATPCNPAPVVAEVGTVDVIRDRPNALTVQGVADQAAWLIVADTYYVGWQVTVNGVGAHTHRANLAFRAVQVPQGPFTVEFRYEPPWLWAGGIASLIGLVGLLFLFSWRPLWEQD